MYTVYSIQYTVYKCEVQCISVRYSVECTVYKCETPPTVVIHPPVRRLQEAGPLVYSVQYVRYTVLYIL